MIKTSLYTFILISITGGLLTLLSSVGIFISITMQRRLERLQETLEEFINLSYGSDANLTTQMYNLIEKYQLHYIYPKQPQGLILRYIDLNVFFILLLWSFAFIMNYEPPFSLPLIMQISPLMIGIFATLFFRRLLRNTISLENPLLGTIVPPPLKLRSISFLSHFINLSVMSVLKQARLSLMLTFNRCVDDSDAWNVAVDLKEELSCDDFFYYLALYDNTSCYFAGFGEVICRFPSDPITDKPVPVCRNINIPLGCFMTDFSFDLGTDFQAKLLIFTRGEKHPVQYNYRFMKGRGFLASRTDPVVTVNRRIVYNIKKDELNVLSFDPNIPRFQELLPHFKLNGSRYYFYPLSTIRKQSKDSPPHIQICRKGVFID